VFMKAFMSGSAVSEEGLVEDATGTAVSTVSSTPGAISYAAFSGVHDQGVTLLKINGVAPSDANVASGKYSFWSYEHIFTNGAPGDAAAKFLSFIAGDRTLVRQLGYIPIGDMRVAENDR
jgi:phosphate transport system substrate-binding protein